MGSFCTSEASVPTVGDEKVPLRGDYSNQSHIGRDGYSTPTGYDDEDPEITRQRKARSDWMRVINNGHAPDPWVVVAVWEQYDDIDVVEIVFDDGDRALHKSIRAKNFDLAYALLCECSANINSPSATTGDTPLTLAASVGDSRMIQLLLGRLEDDGYGISEVANQSFKNNNNDTAGDIAARSRNKALWALLCPDKLADLVVNNPHALSDAFDTQHSTQRSASTDDPMSPTPPMDIEGDAGETGPPSFSPVFDIPPAAAAAEGSSKTPPPLSSTTPKRPAPPRRSSSVAVINGIPEDVAPAVEWKGGYILKRKPDWLGSWQRRYLLVKGDYLGWASEEVNVEDTGHPRERKKFNSYEHLNKVDTVEAVQSSSNCKFRVLVSNATKSNAPREYEFKTETPEERDEWVQLIRRAVKRVRKASGGSGSRRSPRR